jgi:hypothetical protein
VTKPPAAFHREPPAQSGQGRLLVRSRTSLSVTASEVIRTAPFALGQNPQDWSARTIEANFAVPRNTIGIIDSYGFAQDVPDMRGQLRIFRSEGEDKAEHPHVNEKVLTVNLQLSAEGFAWLWGEMQARSGTLTISLDFPALVPDELSEFKHLTATSFVDVVQAEEEAETLVGLALNVQDRWGG